MPKDRAIVIEADQEERVVTFMTEPKPNFVSLVKRGANQQPWRVVKNDKHSENQDSGRKERNVPRKVLQAIVVPDGTPEEAVKAAFGEEVKLDVSKSAGGYTNYEQLPRNVFKEDSFELVVIDEAQKIQGIAAELVEPEQESFVMKLFKPKAQKMNAIELPDDVQKVESEEVKKQVASQVYDEFYRMESAVTGLLSQEKGNAKDKLNALKMVLSNFVEFVEEAFTVAKLDATDLEDFPLISMQSISDVKKAGRKISNTRMAQLKNVQAMLAEFIGELEAPTDTTPSAAGDKPEEQSIKTEEEVDMTKEETQALFGELMIPLQASLDALKTSVEDLSKAQATMKSQLDEAVASVAKIEKTVPMIDGREADDVAPAPKDTKKTQKDEDVFAGSLFRVQ